MESPDAQSGDLALVIRGVSKAFGATQALEGASLSVRAGEAHALVGGNGSGKSTLIKILGGVERADAGALDRWGREIDVTEIGPEVAHDLGMRFIHQQGSTFLGLSVAENLAAGVGYPKHHLGNISWRALRRNARSALDLVGLDVDVDTPLDHVRPVIRQMIAIARALSSLQEVERGVIVLDEPTAALAAPEVEILHEALRRLKADGHTVIYVTHRLEELPGFADQATLLRDGHVVASLAGDAVTHRALVDLLTEGEGLEAEAQHVAPRRESAGAPRLEVRDICGGPVRGVSFDVQPGKIVGLAGLAGSGRSSIMQMIFGVLAPVSGEIRVDGRRLKPGSRPHAGVAYVPEDRLSDGIFGPLSIRDNLFATRAPSDSRWRIPHRLERERSGAALMEYRVKAPGEWSAIDSLSGGNQQKVLIARWIEVQPTVLLLDEPTQGIDVAARAEIHRHIRRAASVGTAVVVASSDAPELTELCDEVVIVVQGRSAEMRDARATSPERLERLSHGLTSTPDAPHGG